MLDACLYPQTLGDADLETLRLFGVEAVVCSIPTLPAATSKRLLTSFDELLERHLPRLERAGLRGYAVLGVHPQSLPRRGLFEVLSKLPGYLATGRVAALGELGVSTSGEAGREAFFEQLLLAKRLRLPVLLAASPDSPINVIRTNAEVLEKASFPAGKVLVQGVDLRSARLVLARGHHAALRVRADFTSAEQAVALVRKLGPRRLVLSSGAGQGPSDLLAVPRTVHRLESSGLSHAVVSRVAQVNARRFFSLAG